ncbi:long-chain-fatty-acid--CoA ligase [Desulfoferula mesophila]|uniref:Long-chain-fatty-acid--CoA ligase n=1 Tax=Desulfoferula mesophila TaxID=3058419 RepID=A0AAU9EM63_9BACT|nr:long-chain-fatty-acid--CoA ligase [Desulfoferula mesophilus]
MDRHLHPAVIQGEDTITYAQLDRRAGHLAAGLAGLGLAAGDRVALCAPNSVEWLYVYFAALKLGATAVTLSNQLSAQELSLLAGHARPKAVYADPAHYPVLEALRETAGISWIIGAGGDHEPAALMPAASEPLGAVERERDHTACVLYTGGTTGTPKGVMLSHENINTAIHNVVRMEGSNENDRVLCFLPFNHVFGQMHIMNATVLSAGCLVLLPGYNQDEALEAVARHGVTKLYAVPTVYVRLLQLSDLKARLGKVRYCFSAAASLAREHVLRWREATGLAIHEAYGMTETASMVTFNHHRRHLVGSVGEPVGTTEVSIRDAGGLALPTGQSGEICIRGRNVMQGYLDNPSDTRDLFYGDWLRSGDVGYLDQDGYLFIVDRLKEMIITGGENVYPREVEEVIFQWRQIAECSVIGLPDPEYGERVVAVCVPTPGESIDALELRAFLKTKLSGYKVPKEFVIKNDLPKSPAGKMLKREIKKDLIEG